MAGECEPKTMKSTKRVKNPSATPNYAFECSICKKNFRYESERNRHEQSHSQKFKCDICSKSFSFVSALKRHKQQHSRTLRVKCDICNKTFLDKTLLVRHINYAHKDTFQCKTCSATFNSDLALKNHSLTHSSPEKRKYRCSFVGCDKTFNFSHHLRNHECTHTNAKQYYCSICGKGFVQSQHLKSHIKVHDPDSWLPCTFSNCNKKFTTEYARKRHLSLHDGLCYSCGDSVTLKSLEKHLAKCIANADGRKTIVNTNNVDQDPKENEIETYKLNPKKHKKVVSDEKVEKSDKSIEYNGNSKDTIFSDLGLANDCHTALGACIVTNDEGECLCAQINNKTNVSDPNKDKKEGKKEDSVNPKITEDVPNEDQSCKGCSCSKTPVSDVPFKPTCKDSMPSLQFRPDGVIKLVDTYDVNIVTLKNVNDNVEMEKPKISVPVNSCKAVLGNCIVSSDGNIGEGCLCAKMSTESNNVLDDEIAMRVFDS